MSAIEAILPVNASTFAAGSVKGLHQKRQLRCEPARQNISNKNKYTCYEEHDVVFVCIRIGLQLSSNNNGPRPTTTTTAAPAAPAAPTTT